MGASLDFGVQVDCDRGEMAPMLAPDNARNGLPAMRFLQRGKTRYLARHATAP